MREWKRAGANFESKTWLKFSNWYVHQNGFDSNEKAEVLLISWDLGGNTLKLQIISSWYR